MPFDLRLLYRSDVKYVDNAKGVTLSSFLDGYMSTVSHRSTANYSEVMISRFSRAFVELPQSPPFRRAWQY
jgi:hypothetical protein